MAKKVLVAYGSKYGGTKEIAEKIGEVLRQENMEVDVLSGDRAGDPTQYEAFVIGSGVYAGMWRKEAVKFVLNNEKMLADKPVWIFSSGPTGEGDVKDLMSGWEYPGKIRPAIESIKPRDITAFHGVADPEKMSFFDKLILKMVKAPTGDFRNWDMISDWAKNIAAELKK
ncbi:MAG: flavodoxin domain-containing protein [Dehalococcoidales bacterium]|nr:MAG: flavodoxin domain-containing protein [Dehalococcoidales bacterium]